MAKAKTPKKASSEVRQASEITTGQIIFLLIDRIASLLRVAFWFLGIMGIGYIFVVLPLRETTGKTTIVNFLFRMIGSLQLHTWMSAATAAVFMVLWGRERKLHRDDVQRLHTETKRLQELIDADRTTSGLTPRGDSP